MQPSDAHHVNPLLQAKLQSLYGRRGTPVINLTIRADFHELLRRLGNPHESLPPVIHVAGTNGKGSTIAFMRAVLEAAGKRVHVYTSPHLVRFNERIVLAGREIDDAALETLLDEVIAANNGPGGDLGNTFFELKTAMAFAAFSRAAADYLLLEVGMGGRLDATNVVKRPVVTVITPIGLDHQEFLGQTVAAIAGEKAGIMKPGASCIVAAQDDDSIDDVFAARAVTLAAPLFSAGREWAATATPDGMRFRFGEKSWDLPPPALFGAHQIGNAGTALAALHCLPGFAATPEIMAAGLRAAHWPGRLERLPDPAQGWELWADGAHNAHGAQALARQLAAWHAADGKPLHLIVGILRKRSPETLLSHLLPYASSLTAIPLPAGVDGHAPQELVEHAASQYPELTIETASSVKAALASQTAGERGRFVLTGSLYLMQDLHS